MLKLRLKLWLVSRGKEKSTDAGWSLRSAVADIKDYGLDLMDSSWNVLQRVKKPLENVRCCRATNL